MIIKYLTIAVSFTLINFVECKNNVPVLLWGNGAGSPNFRVPALKKLSTSEFYENLLKKVLFDESPTVALFIEESLSLEDLRWEDANERNMYPLVQKQMETHTFKTFVPYVDNPVKVLRSLTDDNFKVSAFDSKHLPNVSRTVFLVELDDVKEDEDRPDLLRRHDKFIYETCKLVEIKYGNTICILTASRQSWIEPVHFSSSFSRKLLQSAEGNKVSSPLNVCYLKNFGMLYTKTRPRLLDLNSKTALDLTLDSKTVTKNKMSLSVRVVGFNETDKTNSQTVNLQFNFDTNSDSWQLKNITVSFENLNRTTMFPSIYIGASFGHSFHTPSKVIFRSENYELEFNTLQVELFSVDSGMKFSVAEDTVFFFTIPILSGLFVTGLLITIVLIGLSMIFDIKTMDLFDDPKGKTVTINALE